MYMHSENKMLLSTIINGLNLVTQKAKKSFTHDVITVNDSRQNERIKSLELFKVQILESPNPKSDPIKNLITLMITNLN